MPAIFNRNQGLMAIRFFRPVGWPTRVYLGSILIQRVLRRYCTEKGKRIEKGRRDLTFHL